MDAREVIDLTRQDSERDENRAGGSGGGGSADDVVDLTETPVKRKVPPSSSGDSRAKKANRGGLESSDGEWDPAGEVESSDEAPLVDESRTIACKGSKTKCNSMATKILWFATGDFESPATLRPNLEIFFDRRLIRIKVQTDSTLRYDFGFNSIARVKYSQSQTEIMFSFLDGHRPLHFIKQDGKFAEDAEDQLELINEHDGVWTVKFDSLKVFTKVASKLQADSFLGKLTDNRTGFDVRVGKFERECQPIGRGGFGFVYRCCHVQGGDVMAMKEIPITMLSGIDPNGFPGPGQTGNRLFELVEREIKILQKVSHPNIIRYVGHFFRHPCLHLVTELATGGDLLDRINDRYQSGSPYTEAEAKVIMKSFFSALAYLHANSIIHRDIKPDNVLLSTKASDTDIRLADFGLSRIVSCDDSQVCGRKYTNAGTVEFKAPEVFTGSYGKTCDIWSSGVLLHALLHCQHPIFQDATNQHLSVPTTQMTEQHTMCSCAKCDSMWSKYTPMVRDLTAKLLLVNTKDRIKLEDIEKHPWLAQS